MAKRPGMKAKWEISEQFQNFLVFAYIASAVLGTIFIFLFGHTTDHLRHTHDPWWTWVADAGVWSPVLLLLGWGVLAVIGWSGKELWKIRPKRVWESVEDARAVHQKELQQ